IIVRGGSRSEGVDTCISEGVSLYQQELYGEVVRVLEGCVLTDSLSEKVLANFHLCLGISHFFEGNNEKALFHFDQVINSYSYEDQTIWFTALTYLQMGEMKLCQEKLQSLISDPLFGPKSQVLLEQIKQIPHLLEREG
ncbi:MAG: hypothetical protein AAF399_07130, partial [Bacteroidota bacterium]